MAGLLPIKSRQGNRLEYLAQYILSAFGSAAPVLRAEDVGVDFYCSLGQEGAAGIAVSDAFAVQIKSGFDPVFELGGMTAGGTWRDYELNWFLDLEVPLFLGIPHAKKRRLDLYATSLVRFITYEKDKLPYLVRIVAGTRGDSRGPIHPDQKGRAARKSTRAKLRRFKNCDGRIYEYRLGPPVISCRLEDLSDKVLFKKLRDRLRELLATEHLNCVYRSLSLPYWTWANQIKTNKSHKLAFALDEKRIAVNPKPVLAEAVPFVAALGFAYSVAGKQKKLEQLKGIASQLPKRKVPKVIKDELPSLFS